jgi:hypothetical protein
VGHRTISGIRAQASGFADDLVLVTRSAADMSRLLQVVADRDEDQTRAASMLSCRDVAIAHVDQGPLTWAQVLLSVNNVQFDDSCLDAKVRIHAAYKVTTKDRCTKIERDCSLIGTVNQCRFRLLKAESPECQGSQARGGIATEYLCDSILTWIAHVEKHELKRGFRSHQIWH